MLTTPPPHTHFHDKRDIKHAPERNKSNGQAGPHYYNNNRCLILFHYSKLSLICLGGLINRGMLCYAFIEIGIRLTLINYKGVQS